MIPPVQPAPPSQPNSTGLSPHEGSLHQFFAPGGVLSRTHPAYEFRRGQLQMAQAVEEALAELVALGLVTFGVYSWCEARWRAV